MHPSSHRSPSVKGPAGSSTAFLKPSMTPQSILLLFGMACNLPLNAASFLRFIDTGFKEFVLPGLAAAAAVTYEEADTFLRKFMPLRDTFLLSEDFIYNNINAALWAHNSSRWGNSIPDDIFLDYVLPYSRSDHNTVGCMCKSIPGLQYRLDFIAVASPEAIIANALQPG